MKMKKESQISLTLFKYMSANIYPDYYLYYTIWI